MGKLIYLTEDIAQAIPIQWRFYDHQQLTLFHPILTYRDYRTGPTVRFVIMSKSVGHFTEQMNLAKRLSGLTAGFCPGRSPADGSKVIP